MPILLTFVPAAGQSLIRAGGCPSDMGDFLEAEIVHGTSVGVTVHALPMVPSMGISMNTDAIVVRTTPFPPGTSPLSIMMPTQTMSGTGIDIAFSLGNNGETPGKLHKLVVTVHDDAGGGSQVTTTFTVFYYVAPVTTTTALAATGTKAPVQRPAKVY
jgi:hypothetical protein